jgi:SAM-dependent methyltransferase
MEHLDVSSLEGGVTLGKLVDFADILISPDDGTPLKTTFDSQGVMSACASQSRTFRVFHGVPVLLPASGVASDDKDPVSLVPRRHPSMRALSRVLNGANKVAAINAGHFLKKLRDQCAGRKPRVLVVGAGLIGDGSEALYEEADIELIAFDIYRTEYVQMVADAHSIPLASASIDGVWIQAVLEHVVEPQKVAAEMHRVLRDGGLIYAETPFMQQVHEGRFDFQRFTESGHRWLFRHFELVDSGVVWGPGWTLQWAIRYFFWGLTRSRTLGIALSAPFIFVRLFDRLMPRDFRSDGASNLYFMGKKTGHSLKVDDLISFYQGAQH